jgi:hypothetical protein
MFAKKIEHHSIFVLRTIIHNLSRHSAKSRLAKRSASASVANSRNSGYSPLLRSETLCYFDSCRNFPTAIVDKGLRSWLSKRFRRNG